jgi:hypothetical protein
MVLLQIAQYAMAVAANANRFIVAAMIGDMVQFDALPPRIAAFSAARFIGA